MKALRNACDELEENATRSETLLRAQLEQTSTTLAGKRQKEIRPKILVVCVCVCGGGDQVQAGKRKKEAGSFEVIGMETAYADLQQTHTQKLDENAKLEQEKQELQTEVWPLETKK